MATRRDPVHWAIPNPPRPAIGFFSWIVGSTPDSACKLPTIPADCWGVRPRWTKYRKAALALSLPITWACDGLIEHEPSSGIHCDQLPTRAWQSRADMSLGQLQPPKRFWRLPGHVV